MSDDSYRELRRLAKKLGISFKGPGSGAPPPEHQETFNLIAEIRNKNLDDYRKDITLKSSEPWRQQTYDRAKWLASRAANLVSQQRNEAGWRFSLENDVFHRFRVEVACPKCRARIWKSEFEAYAKDCDLKRRRDRREPCNCPPEHRPRDSYYDVGENPLFDDRAEELIMHGPLVEILLPKKKPDRIFGLKKTKAFDKILDADRRDGDEASRCSPFKDCNDPLLFPFLIIEAKPEKRSVGFEETQTQTVLPIWELLKLQENIRTEVSTESYSASPLVWFFANRGDSWRVYGCYITQNEPKQYEIMQLWDGCITDEVNSLQLLLIVDYIADWARDIYRPSILKHLKSTVTEIAYDQVSLSHDSDVISRKSAYPRRHISTWIPPPPTFIDVDEIQDGILYDPKLLKSILPISVPNTERGTLRSASLFESRIFRVRLTEHNVKHLLRFSRGVYRDNEKSETLARAILNLLSGPNDCIAMQGTDLDFFEDSWRGDTNAEARAHTFSNSTTFYMQVEIATFMTNAWNIARELSYIAVSKPALDALISAANFMAPRRTLDSLVQRARQCNITVLRDTIECLRLGSSWLHFSAAISCTRVSLCSLPVRKRADNTPDTEALGFTRTSQLRMRRIIEQCHKYRKKQPVPKILKPPFGMSKAEALSLKDINPKPEQLTFIRDLERTQVMTSYQEHNSQLCERCHYVSNVFEEDYRLSMLDEPAIPEHGMVLVETLDLTTPGPATKHDLCLMAFDINSEITDSCALSVVVDDLLQGGKIFHTIRHPLPLRYANEYTKDTVWNLPLPYRPVTKNQREDVQNWSLELQGRDIPTSNNAERTMDYWSNLQFVLFFLSYGLTYEDTCARVEALLAEKCNRSTFYSRELERPHVERG